jgi:hypothetical protein
MSRFLTCPLRRIAVGMILAVVVFTVSLFTTLFVNVGLQYYAMVMSKVSTKEISNIV